MLCRGASDVLISVHTEENLDEVWRYDPADSTWTFINVKGKKPEPRYLHTAVAVQDAMLVFGGTKKTAGEVWSFSFRKLVWSKLSNVCCLPLLQAGMLLKCCWNVT